MKDGAAYPAVLLVTALNDPRVPVWQPAKLAARLQAASHGGKPVLLRVDDGATKSQAAAKNRGRIRVSFVAIRAAGFSPVNALTSRRGRKQAGKQAGRTIDFRRADASK